MRYAAFLFLIALQACGGVSAQEAEFPEEDLETPLTVKSAVADTTGNIAAEAGFITDGDSITIPTGFVASQCVFTAALSSVSGSAISTSVTVNKTSGLVTCKSLSQERANVRPTQKSCTASYTVICAK